MLIPCGNIQRHDNIVLEYASILRFFYHNIECNDIKLHENDT